MSSPSYIKHGLALGLPKKLLQNAVNQSESLIYSDVRAPSILTLNHLATRTGVQYEWLRSFIMRKPLKGIDDFQCYKKFSIRKRTGGRRFINVPHPKLMQVQQWISEHILKHQAVHPASHAFRKGDSILKCASRHCGAKWLIKIDISDFFSSISEIQVYRVFLSLNYQPLVAFELSRLCTVESFNKGPRLAFTQWHNNNFNKIIPLYHQDLLGHLPQGAPTSPLIANLIMKDCDSALQLLAKNNGLNYTRYSDDLSFSTNNAKFGRKNAKKVVYEAYKILSQFGFQAQFRKTNIIPPGSKKIILGLNIEGETPKLTKHIKDKIRQHLYYLEKLGPVQHAFNRGFDSIWGLKVHLRGLIDYANMIEPDLASAYLEKFNAIEWPI